MGHPRPPASVFLLLLPLLLGAEYPLPKEGRYMNSCIQAKKKCQSDSTCGAAYYHLSSCISNISTPMALDGPSVPEDCLEAAQHLRNSSLMSCTCHRRKKNQEGCLKIYWTVHPARSIGDYELDISPYEDTVTRKPWKLNLNKLKQLNPDSDLCLKFAMLCTLNDKCDRLRKAFGEVCSESRCQQQGCLRQLRAFFEKAPLHLAEGLLLCPCAPADEHCGLRRRNTIAPDCALPSGTTNCLELRSHCLADPLCRSRLADFQTHCHPMDILGTCATEPSRCLQAYMGLIGTVMTPNYVSTVNTSVALKCTCRGSGNLQEECEQLEEAFTHNPCLMEAIADKIRSHSHLFSQDVADSTFSVMEQQNTIPDLESQSCAPSLSSCILPLILFLSLW